MPQEESRERFEESLEVILRAWTNERLSYQGRYFRVQDVQLTPKPVQKPHPPIRIAANSPDTFAIAGRLGLPDFRLAAYQSARQVTRILAHTP